MTRDEVLAVQARQICWHGMLLFLLGLLTGVAIPWFTNPRMGLSAHLGGVQNGMFLLLLGLLWPRLALGETLRRLASLLAVTSMHAIWLGLVLAAWLGTSRATPIAGAGFSGSALSEGVVSALLGAGSLAIVAAAAMALRGLSPGRGRS